jgi:hypothetical protein
MSKPAPSVLPLASSRQSDGHSSRLCRASKLALTLLKKTEIDVEDAELELCVLRTLPGLCFERIGELGHGEGSALWAVSSCCMLHMLCVSLDDGRELPYRSAVSWFWRLRARLSSLRAW